MVWGQPVVLSDGRVLIVGSSGASAPAELYNPRTGTISPTGSMSTVRSGPTAVLLPDGRVLVAGGFGAGNVVFASAELYQP
jgi:Flp pilus assembly secretin CpaC